ATFSASPRSIWAVTEPAAPNASLQNCSRAEAVLALFLISSSAKFLVSSLLSSSSTSRPLTIAPAGLIRSWHTREHQSPARSSPSRLTAVGGDEASAGRAAAVAVPDMQGVSGARLWGRGLIGA